MLKRDQPSIIDVFDAVALKKRLAFLDDSGNILDLTQGGTWTIAAKIGYGSERPISEPTISATTLLNGDDDYNAEVTIDEDQLENLSLQSIGLGGVTRMKIDFILSENGNQVQVHRFTLKYHHDL